MKKPTGFWLRCAVVLLFGILGTGWVSSATGQTQNDSDIKQFSTSESNAFRYEWARTVAFYRSQNQYEYLLQLLNRIDESRYNLDAKIEILYYRAICNQQVGNYAIAQHQFWALKMLISDTENPLFKEAEQRIAESRAAEKSAFNRFVKEVNRMNADPVGFARRVLPVGMMIGTIVLIAIFFLWKARWINHHIDYSLSFLERIVFAGPEKRTKKNGGEGKGKKERPIAISETESLISEEDMIAQDGRVSDTDVMKYRHAKEKAGHFKHSRLIIEGHRMIRSLNRCPPYTLVLLQKIPYLQKLHPFWRDTIFGMGLVCAWTSFSYLIDFSLLGAKPPELMFRFLVSAVLISALAGIRIMATRTIDALDELVTLVENHETLAQIKFLIYTLFRSPWQIFITLVLFTVYLYSNVIFRGHYSVDIIFVPILCWLISPLIWFLIRGVSVTYRISNLRDLETNPLSPLKTLGLQKWISVIGSYSLIGSIVLTAGGGIPLIRAFLQGGGYTIWQSIWLLLFFPVILMTWIYPYFKLKGLVRRMKQKRMHMMKTLISRTFDDWIRLEKCLKDIYSVVEKDEPDKETIISALKERSEMYNMIKPEFEQMKGYHAIFLEIDKSPESFFDIRAAVELTQVMGIPTLFALASYFLEQVKF